METIQSKTADMATLVQSAAEEWQSSRSATTARQLDAMIVEFLRVLCDERQDWSAPHTWPFFERLHGVCRTIVTEGLHSTLAVGLRSLAAGLADDAAVLWEPPPAAPDAVPVFLESVAELERQGVPARQIARMYGEPSLSLPDAMAYVADLKSGKIQPPPRRTRHRDTAAPIHPGLVHYCGSILPA